MRRGDTHRRPSSISAPKGAIPLTRYRNRQRTIKDMVGERHGRLTVISLWPERGVSGRTLWLCRCDCGTEKIIGRWHVLRVQSCGCFLRECRVSRMADPENLKKRIACLHSPEARKKASETVRKRPLAERFYPRAHPEPNSGCWLWTGPCNGQGYGRLQVDGKYRHATHVALELDGRPRPFAKAFALHSCDNPICVNPDHLRWGTPQDNVDDAQKRHRLNLSGLMSYREWRAWVARGGK